VPTGHHRDRVGVRGGKYVEGNSRTTPKGSSSYHRGTTEGGHNIEAKQKGSATNASNGVSKGTMWVLHLKLNARSENNFDLDQEGCKATSSAESYLIHRQTE